MHHVQQAGHAATRGRLAASPKPTEATTQAPATYQRHGAGPPPAGVQRDACRQHGGGKEGEPRSPAQAHLGGQAHKGGQKRRHTSQNR